MQYWSDEQGCSLMTSSLMLLVMKKLKHISDLTKMMRLYENKFSLAMARKDQLTGP